MVLGCWGAVWKADFSSAFPQDAEAGFNEALQAFRVGDRQKAVTVLEETLKAQPDHAPSHELLGLALSALGKSEEALQHLREALRLWPDQPVYWTNLAIFYLRQSRRRRRNRHFTNRWRLSPALLPTGCWVSSG